MVQPSYTLVQRSIAESVIAGRRASLLAVAARAGIGAKGERFAFDEANAALDRTRRNEARHRAVLMRLG